MLGAWPGMPRQQDSRAQFRPTLSPLQWGDLGAACVLLPAWTLSPVKCGEGTCLKGGQTFRSCPGAGKSRSWGPL